MASVVEPGKQMLCPECSWHWNYEDDGIRCPFCATAIGLTGPDDPEEAKKEIAQFNSE